MSTCPPTSSPSSPSTSSPSPASSSCWPSRCLPPAAAASPSAGSPSPAPPPPASPAGTRSSFGTIHAFFGTIQVDAFSVFFHLLIAAVVARHPAQLARLLRRQRHPRRRVLRPGPLRRRRHDADDLLGRAADGLHRPRDLLHLHLHPGRLPQGPRHRLRGLHQVLPARLLRHGLLPLRHRPRLRRHRLHQHLRHRPRPRPPPPLRPWPSSPWP